MTQRANLYRVADHLESLPEDYPHFDMRFFARATSLSGGDADAMAVTNPRAFFSLPGACACVLSHAVAAGVAPVGAELRSRGFDGHNYAIRALGVAPLTFAGQFLFGAIWASLDPHHYAAAARIRYYLDRGRELDGVAGDTSLADLIARYTPYRKTEERLDVLELV